MAEWKQIITNCNCNCIELNIEGKERKSAAPQLRERGTEIDRALKLTFCFLLFTLSALTMLRF